MRWLGRVHRRETWPRVLKSSSLQLFWNKNHIFSPCSCDFFFGGQGKCILYAHKYVEAGVIGRVQTRFMF